MGDVGCITAVVVEVELHAATSHAASVVDGLDVELRPAEQLPQGRRKGATERRQHREVERPRRQQMPTHPEFGAHRNERHKHDGAQASPTESWADEDARPANAAHGATSSTARGLRENGTWRLSSCTAS